MLERVLGVVKLDAAIYQEIDQDDTATGQAVLVAIVAALIGGISSLGSREVFGEMVPGSSTGAWLVSALIGVPIFLAIGTAILLALGKIFGGQAEFKGLFRTLGFAQAPNVLGFIPIVGGLASLWTLVCGVIAVRESHSITTGQAVITVLIPVIVIGVLIAIIAVVLGVALAGVMGGVLG